MRILYVTTISSTINAFLVPHIKLLLEMGHTVDIASNITDPINQDLLKLGCNIYNVDFQRSITDSRNYFAYCELKRLINKNKYDVVHTHTPIASFYVRLACRLKKNIKVIYTAHGFHFYKGAPIINWFVFFPIEKYLSRYTDIIITINREDYNRARKFKNSKVVMIPGIGFDYIGFRAANIDRSKKRKELGIPESAFIVLSVGELNNNKNHKTIIKAISKINNNNIYYIICGRGPNKSKLKSYAANAGIRDRLLLLGQRKDIKEICRVSDVFAFPSKREGLGISALEAMASGLPIVTSNVHGIIDYSIDKVTGFIYKPNDVNGFACGIERLANDNNLRVVFGKNNAIAAKKYALENSINEMRKIYNDLFRSIA
jgi:glycosyltransferase involved in cell wall biosynthesis